MAYKILKKYDQVKDYVCEVASIADSNRAQFGFLPASAYEEMAAKEQLWIAIDDKNLLRGYLIFGGAMPTLKIFQVYACPSERGSGIGRLLVNDLKEFAKQSHYHSISARVAADLEANGFWEKMGFIVHQQVNGGRTTNRRINVRGVSLEDNDLLSALKLQEFGIDPSGPILERPIYAIDLNLLIAIVKARPGYQKIARILQIGLQGGYTICVTPEFTKELGRQSTRFSDDPLMRIASVFPEVDTELDVDILAKKIREIVFPIRSLTSKNSKNDESDLRHLAYCISAKINGFVTREKALLRASSDIKSKYGISIISPDELVYDDEQTFAESTPLNADFSFIKSRFSDETLWFLKGFSPPRVVAELIAAGGSPLSDGVSVCEARLNGNLFGVYFCKMPNKGTSSALAFLYVDETFPQSIAVIDHFIETTLRCRRNFTYRIDFYIGKGQVLTEETLLKKGFLRSGEHFVKILVHKFLDANNWPQFSRDLKALCGFLIPEKLPPNKELENTGICIYDNRNSSKFFTRFQIETIIGPRFILSSNRDCVLVPIQENYANGLIGNVKKQQSLLSSHETTLLLEKAYFRSARKASIFKPGAIVAFYVSGAKSIQEIIGFARITYSAVINTNEMPIKVLRQGVLSRDKLLKLADRKGRVHVFTFDNFLEFDRRISFKKKVKSSG